MDILVVEDEQVTQQLFERILSAEGHQVHTCSDAESAWELCQTKTFPLIVLDWLLPGMDGLELCRRIRALPNGDRCVILVATVREGKEDLETVLAAGADDYLNKPVSLGVLKIRLTIAEQWVKDRIRRRTAEDQLARSHDDLLAILNQLRVGTALADNDGRITFVNQIARSMFWGTTAHTYKGQPWEELFPFVLEDKARLRQVCNAPPEQRERLSAPLENARGQRYWMDIEVQDDPRDPRGKVFLFYDMSEVYDLRRQLNDKAQFYDLIGKSKAMCRVYEQIREVAGVDSTVLIEGQTGTGKELVARAIHAASHRRDRPFIAVNCAGLTEALIGSQLFGHRRGAFTGAIENHEGVFEAAHGGTLFLDEVGDIPPGIQASLLRVLQEREITRLGESKPRKIDVRVLTATHRDLADEVEAGRFRQDLLYRIRIARIELPGLKERREDIPLLVATFLRKCRSLSGKDVSEISPETMQMLMGYHWPGNVRELENAVEYAVVRSTGPVLHPDDLPPELKQAPAPLSSINDPPPIIAEQDDRERLMAALEQAKGNRTIAARLLGVSRATFYRRLAAYDIR